MEDRANKICKKYQGKGRRERMYYVGIDIGSTASKTVVTGDKETKFVYNHRTLHENAADCGHYRTL